MSLLATVMTLALQQTPEAPETIRWAKDWDEAAARSREEKRPILAHAFFQGPLVWDEKTAAGEFALPEVIALVNERYVALKLGPGVAVPFAAAELYGLGAHTFGTALLVCAPDGRVVLDRFGPAWEVLVEGLTAIPDLPGPPAPHFQEPLAQARALLRRGDLAGALAVAQPVGTAAALQLIAHAHFLARDAEAGLAAIVAAKKAAGADALASDLAHDEVDFLIKVGRLDDAKAAADAFARTYPADPRSAALAQFSAALANFPYPPDTLRFTPRAVVESLLPVAPAPLPPAEAKRAAADGADWLVKTQCADGSWASPSQYGSNLDPRWNALAVAISALATEALLDHLERPGAAPAFERALQFLATTVAARRKAPFAASALDYSPWAWAALVGALARASEGDEARKGKLAPSLAAAIEGLSGCVAKDGGFTYITGTSLAAAPGATPSTSFTTAYVLHALLDARDAELPIDEGLLDGALALLAKCKGGDGAFSYVAQADPLRDGAALRGPLCVHALLRAGNADERELAAALEKFRERLPVLAHERHHTLMHCGPQGEGSHWLLFDLWTAAAAARELPADARAPYRALLLPEVLAARRADGAFCDMPLLGPACGTAQALLALRELEP
jgi:hypothetical protein